jgi:hypothetical protein
MSRITNPGRLAGVLYVVTSIFGFFAMGYPIPPNPPLSWKNASASGQVTPTASSFRRACAKRRTTSDCAAQDSFIQQLSPTRSRSIAATPTARNPTSLPTAMTATTWASKKPF